MGERFIHRDVVDDDDTPIAPEQYVIIGPEDPLDHELLYWSNEQGWVSFEEATIFEAAETQTLNLPDEGNWERI